MSKGSEPKFILNITAVIASIIFFPIGIFILAFATFKYLSEWVCYNFDWPYPICYIISFFFTPFLLPLLVLSAIFSYSKKVESPKRSSPKRSSPKSKSKLKN